MRNRALKDFGWYTNINKEVNPVELRIYMHKVARKKTKLYKYQTYEGRRRIPHILTRRSSVQRKTRNYIPLIQTEFIWQTPEVNRNFLSIENLVSYFNQILLTLHCSLLKKRKYIYIDLEKLVCSFSFQCIFSIQLFTYSV